MKDNPYSAVLEKDCNVIDVTNDKTAPIIAIAIFPDIFVIS